MVQEKVTIIAQHGIHARPASLIANAAMKLKSDIKLIKGEEEFNAKSVMLIMAAGIANGEEIIIQATGEDEEKAVKILKELFDSGFEE